MKQYRIKSSIKRLDIAQIIIDKNTFENMPDDILSAYINDIIGTNKGKLRIKVINNNFSVCDSGKNNEFLQIRSNNSEIIITYYVNDKVYDLIKLKK